MDDWNALRDALEGLDADTAELIIQLGLEDISAPAVEPGPRVECTSCSHLHPLPDNIKAPCGHDYCAACLENLYSSCMTDESLFPPRCCRQPFPWELVREKLSDDLQAAFPVKRIELETQNRTYCYVATCSAFIKPGDYDKHKAPCPECQSITCVKCKRQTHDGVCGEDGETEEFLARARQNGWQRCFGCRRVVELNIGCNHMTCLCGAQFCYVCGLVWKTCPCRQWDERRLLDRAEAQVNNARRGGGGAAGARDAPNHVAQVARAAQNLRDNHECNHGRWTRRRTGSLQCEECLFQAQVFVDECDRCHLRACYRCRTNRL
ncbi:hypothetical protein LTR91_000380 [Friedmanniomyces endolithicus]|uniref:RBR-type E3 ubiquitin transferase n=1 Tax=Friedmanniomyces endolithicus TaxID=329885 RepID=A0AAN6L4H1_9PEZI|nr:hypothetical protein LTR35_010071 [Friedmanniomyces endolithicus]KAK0298289.1 hypothetical protein LTS00_003254 [Friedmanniomyces endolithicus]KAK0313711.1 hypothetical protein LTR01_001968 [Friedmanniomyces endolithicus]KAK0323830.1 hypothetical protein LTR82_004950 [Friedmanniomyces endolithicus]KAK0830502.1 hypothetical protein LTR73_003781 [Friedmanniomyces endolithicus]